jgi:hypothetical protein
VRSAAESDPRADVIAARAIGVGVGLLTLMIAWLVGNRLLGLVLDAPEGPTTAFIAALILGVLAALFVGQRCVRSIAQDAVDRGCRLIRGPPRLRRFHHD